MFCGYQLLTAIFALENWNVSKGSDFRWMFSNCFKLTDIKSIENWNIPKEQLELITKDE